MRVTENSSPLPQVSFKCRIVVKGIDAGIGSETQFYVDLLCNNEQIAYQRKHAWWWPYKVTSSLQKATFQVVTGIIKMFTLFDPRISIWRIYPQKLILKEKEV